MLNKVTIIGAGPAGLGAAYRLISQTVPLVIEKYPWVGGISRTEAYKGFRFDIGGHRYFTQIPKIYTMWHSIMGDDLLQVPRASRILYEGNFFHYPLEFADALRKLGLRESLRIVIDYVRVKLAPAKRAESFEEWMIHKFGRRLYETFFKTYTEKVWGIPCTELRADWAMQRIKDLSLRSTLANAFLGINESQNSTLIDAFDYPRLGSGMVWERFADAIENRGGEVWLGAEVTGLRCQENQIISLRIQQGGKEKEMPVSQVISTMPLSNLIMSFDPTPPHKVREAALALSYRAFILVGLIVDAEEIFPDQWIYVHSPEVRVGRVQNFKNWSAAMVPDPAQSGIGMEYFCDEGDPVWMMRDSDLITLAARELEQIGLVKLSQVVDGVVFRQPKAYPVYDREYRECLATIRAWLDGIANLRTAGRNGLHRYDNMDQAMLSGIEAADSLLASTSSKVKAVNDIS